VLDAYQWTHSGWPGSNASFVVLLVLVASSAIASDRHIQAGTGGSKHSFCFIFGSEFTSADFDKSQHYSLKAFGILRGNGSFKMRNNRRSAPTRVHSALGVAAGDTFRNEPLTSNEWLGFGGRGTMEPSVTPTDRIWAHSPSIL
jgi:hypothetical protein